jgi:adenine-specific DNA-methyltransferase
MSTTKKHRTRLVILLKELFQLDKPELDFGLYKIMHAKSVQITHFLESDLLNEIEQAFGEKDSVDASQLKAQAINKLKEALGEDAIDENGQLLDAYAKTPAGQKYQHEIEMAEAAKETITAESEVYDHLYRFFERYYDSGDFMSRRYYARESDARAAPYSVPYDGREVYLHWANKDQYYIKSSEYLTNFTFELNEAIRQEAERQKGQKGKGQGFDFDTVQGKKPLKVHFRIVDASEGEHGNIKASSDQKRFFIIHAANPAFIENGELVIQFQYRNDAERTGQDSKWQETRLQQAEAAIVEALKSDANAVTFLKSLQMPAPTDSKDKRTLLGKYLQKYADRNTMDYFIHKDLGGFLRRELDFYIKNEIMRLDDIENAEAPKVEQYLGKIKVLRRIAHQLIAFLAQLEEFQKKLWLKKKFVTETNYCISLDRIPESFYAEIAANENQREEWVKLFAIDEIKADLAVQVAYSKPLKAEFLKANTFLLVDTGLFDEIFKSKILAEIADLDEQCDGVLIHSENYQALGMMQEKYEEQIECVYIDPPYNTAASEIIYKNEYKHSSWLTLVNDRLLSTKALMSSSANICATIDDVEVNEFCLVLDSIFSRENEIAIVPIRINPSGRPSEAGFALTHEYALFYRKTSKGKICRIPRTEDQLARFNESDEKGVFEFRNLRREGSNSDRVDGQRQYFPIYGDLSKRTVRVPSMTWNEGKREWEVHEEPLSNEVEVFPVNDDGREKNWRWSEENIRKDYSQFLARVPRNGTPQIYYKYRAKTEGTTPLTLWTDTKYSATEHGTKTLKNFFGDSGFSYPKSIFAVEDCLRVSGASDNKRAEILDYFGGSGTTGHAVINLNREDGGRRKFILVEQNSYFDLVLKPRISKAIYSKDWKDGKPLSREGISHCFKYLRLESYEDALNNLVLKVDEDRDSALSNSPTMKRDYLLNYFLNVETQSSQSLLNIADFRDPTAYKMWIKKPGSEEQTQQNIDLIETFNWLIGLWVDHMAAAQTFSAEFEREKDSDLPKDQNTRLVCKRLKQDLEGNYWFRIIEGYTLKVPGDNTSKVKTLIVWRKQTDDAEKDNAALQKYLIEKLQISPRENTYSVIYVNGSHTLPNPVVEGEQTKVRLIEEAFHNAMWAGEAV